MRTPRDSQETDKTKEQLLKAANRVFLREGYGKVSMKMLAEEAGCTTGKFYCNNLGKPELLRLLGVRYRELIRDSAKELLKKYKLRNLSEEENLQVSFLIEMLIFLELARLSETAAELFGVALSLPETRTDISGYIKERLKPTPVEQQSVAYIPFVLSGALFSMEQAPGKAYRELAEPFLRNLLVNLKLTPELNKELSAELPEKEAAIHEQAYRGLVRMLKL